MKTILVFDTETSSLPIWNLPSEDPNQPHIVQLAAELCVEETGETLASMNAIIKPEGWTIPYDVAAIHGITTEHAMVVGIPETTALRMFLALWAVATGPVVAHNHSFDMRIIRIAMMRHCIGDPDQWKAAPAYCTMANSTKILNLPPSEKMIAAGRRGPKSPNLGEAFQFFMGVPLEGAHNAAVDVAACKSVYYGIKSHLTNGGSNGN